MNSIQIQFQYTNGAQLTVTNRSLTESIKVAIQITKKNECEPIKILFLSTSKMLYFDKYKANEFLCGNISQEEFIADTQCDGLFRNKEDIVTDNGTFDKGALWKLCNKKYILIDDDQYIAVIAPDDNFVEV